MRIAIEPSVFSNQKWFPILDTLLMYVDENRHGFDASTSIILLSSPWVKQRPLSVSDLIRLSAVSRAADGDLDASLVVIDDNCGRGGEIDFMASKTTLHPLDAIAFLSTPFQVILENEFFDGAFLLWMAKALNISKFVAAYREGKFVFRHAGGKNSLERSAKTFLHGVWSRRDQRYSRAMRMWLAVVLDNDARFRGDFPNRIIIENTESSVVFVHQLAKRSIESYIPPEYLLKILKQRQVSAYKRLSIEQKLFYHMKKGFRFEKNESPTLDQYRHSTKVSSEEKQLFGSLPHQDWSELRSGFGSGLSVIFIEEKYRSSTSDYQLLSNEDRLELTGLIKRIYERI